MDVQEKARQLFILNSDLNDAQERLSKMKKEIWEEFQKIEGLIDGGDNNTNPKN